MALTVVLGGPASGKSLFALALAASHGPRLGFIATRRPLTPEAELECVRLRAERRDAFVTWEEPLRIPELVAAHGEYLDALVIDDAGEWLANLTAAGTADCSPVLDRLFEAAARCPAQLVLVAEPGDALKGMRDRADHLFEITEGKPVRVR